MLPADAQPSVANALLRGKYEREEADFIIRHMPRELPVIELGGSFGVISRLIDSRLDPAARHLVVEANGDLIAACRANAEADARAGATQVIHAAVAYDGPVARFRVGEEPHANALDAGSGAGRVVEVEAVTFAALLDRLGGPPACTLVADIEGAEFDLFANENNALGSVDTAIVELHPRDYVRRGRSEGEMLRLIERAGLVVAERSADVVLLRRSVSRD